MDESVGDDDGRRGDAEHVRPSSHSEGFVTPASHRRTRSRRAIVSLGDMPAKASASIAEARSTISGSSKMPICSVTSIRVVLASIGSGTRRTKPRPSSPSAICLTFCRELPYFSAASLRDGLRPGSHFARTARRSHWRAVMPRISSSRSARRADDPARWDRPPSGLRVPARMHPDGPPVGLCGQHQMGPAAPVARHVNGQRDFLQITETPHPRSSKLPMFLPTASKNGGGAHGTGGPVDENRLPRARGHGDARSLANRTHDGHLPPRPPPLQWDAADQMEAILADG